MWVCMSLFHSKKGSVEIVLDKYNFTAGESVSGKIKLNVKSPFVSKHSFVRLFAQQKVRRYVNGKMQTSMSTVFDYKYPLEENKQFSVTEEPLEYSFDIKIPNNFNNPASGGVVGKVVNVINQVSGVGAINWYLIAKVNVKGSILNIKKKIKINVV